MRLPKIIGVLMLSLVLPGGQTGWAESVEQSIEQAQALSMAFAHVAEVATPSVVNISSVRTVRPPHQRGQGPQTNPLNPFRDFFGEDFFEHFFPDNPRFGDPRGYKQPNGMGTGFILDPEGHILTNNHVIAEADEVMVKLHDDRTYKAEVVGTDAGTDLAVIKIKGNEDFVPIKLGDSDKLMIGEWVVAVGNPFGLDHTITTGIVSAKGRSISPGSMKYEDYIQTDAAINPGNSGGPLVNLHGEVVGISSAIYTRSGGYMGIGFAIPVNLAKSVLESLLEHGHVVRGWLGVSIQDLTKELAESFGYTTTNGALVGDVVSDGPAEKAGLKAGDIIVRYDGKQVKDVNSLRFAVAATSPGSKVPVEIVREGKTEMLTVKIAELKGEQEAAEGTVMDSSSEDYGLRLQTLTQEIRNQLGIETEGKVIVTEVRPFGAAANAGIRPKDVILKVDTQTPASAAEFFNLLKKRDLKKGVRLIVETEGVKHFVMLRVE